VASDGRIAGSIVDDNVEKDSGALDDGGRVALWRDDLTEEATLIDELSLYVVDASTLESEGAVLANQDEDEDSALGLDDGTTVMPVGEGDTNDESVESNENVGRGREEGGVKLGKSEDGTSGAELDSSNCELTDRSGVEKMVDDN